MNRSARYRRSAAGVIALVSVALVGVGPATASPGTSSDGPAAGSAAGPASNSTVPGIQAQVATLEAQIAQQQQQVASLSEQFDQSTVHLQQVQARLSMIRLQLQTDKRRYRRAHHQLQVDAVNAYVYDEPATSLSTLFSSTSSTGALHNEYQDTAIGNVDAAASAVRSDENRLTTTEARLQSEVLQAETGTTAVRGAEQAAQSATAAAETTLSAVKGQLAQMIAEQAAEQAAHEAALAAAAANAVARRRAAQQAAEDAQVAQTVGAGSAAATAATNSANQAAGSAGSTGVIGTGGPETPQGAGSIALTAAEGYLGVPYEYGGASMSGLDCSGLTMLSWRAAGISLLHSAAIQANQATPVPLDQVQPGDLLFYDFGGGGIDHVVMYVGSGPYGADTIIQAAHTGTVVEFDPVWYFGLVGAGRP